MIRAQSCKTEIVFGRSERQHLELSFLKFLFFSFLFEIVLFNRFKHFAFARSCSIFETGVEDEKFHRLTGECDQHCRRWLTRQFSWPAHWSVTSHWELRMSRNELPGKQGGVQDMVKL